MLAIDALPARRRSTSSRLLIALVLAIAVVVSVTLATTRLAGAAETASAAPLTEQQQAAS